MFTLSSANGRRASLGRIIAGAAIALAFSAQAAFAQAKPIAPPKQVGIWTITAWSQGYCTAQRVLPGATSDGTPLQFLIARVRVGYRIGLSAPNWELTPRASFPIELIANPIWRSAATATAVGPKVVIVELGASGAFMKKLAAAPMLQVKAAQATFKLSLEGFESAVSELDACYAALKKSASNPFAPPSAGSVQKTAQNSAQ